jgi:RNA polymerase sigma-70 factor (ECF subfamily)
MQSETKTAVDALFQKLFEEYRKPILNYLYRMLGDRERAEELTQDVFVRAYRALERLPGDANHRAWLYRIARNIGYDRLRRRRLISWVPLWDRDRPASMHDDPKETVPERNAVQDALSKLAPKYRSPLILYSVQGHSVKEISTMMGISEGAVKTRLYRARKKFQQVYEGDAD